MKFPLIKLPPILPPPPPVPMTKLDIARQTYKNIASVYGDPCFLIDTNTKHAIPLYSIDLKINVI